MTDAREPDQLRQGTAPWLARLVRAVESDRGIDRRAAVLDGISTPLAHSAAGPLLRGRQLGHALHPVLTDLPLGCWTSASVLDLVGGRSARPAARRLTGLGLLVVVPAAMSGLVEFDRLDAQPMRRVATAHAVGNSVMATCQFLSWRSRRKDRHLRGVAWGLAGGSVGAVAGYLGGHLAFGGEEADDAWEVGPGWTLDDVDHVVDDAAAAQMHVVTLDEMPYAPVARDT